MTRLVAVPLVYKTNFATNTRKHEEEIESYSSCLRGFNLRADYSIEVFAPARAGENGDVAAASQLRTSDAEFALCDPAVAEEITRGEEGCRRFEE